MRHQHGRGDTAPLGEERVDILRRARLDVHAQEGLLIQLRTAKRTHMGREELREVEVGRIVIDENSRANARCAKPMWFLSAISVDSSSSGK